MRVELETASLLVAGMKDARCERSVRSALESIHGVRAVTALPGRSTLVVNYDPTRVIPQQMRTAVRVMGCRIESILLGGDRDLELAAAATPETERTAIGLH